MTISLNFASLATDSHTRRTLSDLSLSVAKSKKIVVVTGAGISCSCGIPDFRSSDGLYALVKEKYPDVVLKGRDLFDASLFRDATSTSVFYTFISQLKRSIDAATPSPTHQFIKTLDTKNKLLRSYTQNIDGLEARVGLLGTSCEAAKSSSKGKSKIRTKEVRNVELHGNIHRVRCMACSAEYPCTEDHLNAFNVGAPPDCPECLSRSEARVARSARPIRVGSLRPAIVLYDEPHPLGDDIGTIQSADVSRKPDMLIIMGTSLKVHGLKKLVKDFARTIHASNSPGTSSQQPFKVIFVNKTPPASEWADVIDYHVAAESDRWVTKVLEDWKKMRPADWEVQQTLVTLDGNTSMSGGLKVIKTAKSSTEIKEKKAPKKAAPRGENIAPPDVGIIEDSTATFDKYPPVPLSPSKRRQGTSHYSDVDSSPSKRHSVSRPCAVMPVGERKLLFTESTNNQSMNSSKMDISICDLSMQDVEMRPKAVEPSVKRGKPSKPPQTRPRPTAKRNAVTKEPAPRQKSSVYVDIVTKR